MLFFVTGFMLSRGVLGMDNFQTKVAMMGPGLEKWCFEIHFQVYFCLCGMNWPAVIVSAEKCVPGTSLVLLFCSPPYKVKSLFFYYFLP